MKLTGEQVSKFWEVINTGGSYPLAMQSIINSTIGTAVDAIWTDKGLAWEDKRYLKEMLEGIK